MRGRTAPSTDEWFSRDASNRLLVSKGKLVGNAVALDAARRESTLRTNCGQIRAVGGRFVC